MANVTIEKGLKLLELTAEEVVRDGNEYAELFFGRGYISKEEFDVIHSFIFKMGELTIDDMVVAFGDHEHFEKNAMTELDIETDDHCATRSVIIIHGDSHVHGACKVGDYTSRGEAFKIEAPVLHKDTFTSALLYSTTSDVKDKNNPDKQKHRKTLAVFIPANRL